jgi:hypothetical protein
MKFDGSTALRALEAAAIRWCLLRGEAGLESGEKDVDLLVAPADIEHACRILAGHGFVRRRSAESAI